ncbi:hypothetical protein HYPSUDRAFT_44661 [Hypholoma sublateritium FD-334 SS-4]|uniref:N-acetyltransferase domain-containing protein n=1 Tax=Hypholoma sublateritium (strain FD-334 SS-4) TaxID=945553 RepID=A0A0D2NQC4_HYPSF|nr:hypothetical protein HYPSUDRAFT_44661 [Hypholoma sublateritium FD-334 SS-4]
MSEITVRRIVEISKDETDQLITILSRAYANHQASRIMLGGRMDLLHLNHQLLIGAGLLGGEIYVVENNKKQILSVALWTAPGKALEMERVEGFSDFIKEIDDETKAWYVDPFKIYINEYVPKVLGKTTLDSWWLSSIATDPDHQGNGYASKLILSKINEISAPNLVGLCATSEDTVNFYNSVGFTSKGYQELPSKFGKLSVWCFSRDII